MCINLMLRAFCIFLARRKLLAKGTKRKVLIISILVALLIARRVLFGAASDVISISSERKRTRSKGNDVASARSGVCAAALDQADAPVKMDRTFVFYHSSSEMFAVAYV